MVSGGFYSHSGYTLRRAVLGATVYGQPLSSRADFWPLDAGNRWEFALQRLVAADGAVAWTVVEDGAGVALRLDRYDGTAVVATVTCPLTVIDPTAASGWQTSFSASCTLPDPALFPTLRAETDPIRVDLYNPSATIGIGGETLTRDVASGGRVRNNGPNGPSQATLIRLARGVGPVHYSVSNPIEAIGSSWTATLGYARVGGTEYGQHVVATDDAPVAATLALTVAPNPAAGTARVRFSLDAAADRLRLVVLDALGRRVAEQALDARAAGPGEVALDVSRLAPGVYTVRLLGAGASARLSVVR